MDLTTAITEGEWHKMAVLDQIISHLESMGYPVVRAGDWVHTADREKPNVVFTKSGSAFLFTGFFVLDDEKVKTGRGALLECINEINSFSGRSYLIFDDEKNILLIRAWFQEAYDTKAFSDFIDSHIRDLGLVRRRKELAEFLV